MRVSTIQAAILELSESDQRAILVHTLKCLETYYLARNAFGREGREAGDDHLREMLIQVEAFAKITKPDHIDHFDL